MKLVDNKKAFSELGIKIDELLQELENFENENGELVPIFVLKNGAIENYGDNISHSLEGAYKLFKQIKDYLSKNETDNENFENLKLVIMKILQKVL